MARTDITTTKLNAATWALALDTAEVSTTIDAALVTAGVRLLCSNPDKVVVRITNTHGSTHVVGVARANAQDNPAADFASTAIPATTGVRWFSFEQRCLQADAGIYLNLDVGHTGAIQAFELAP